MAKIPIAAATGILGAVLLGQSSCGRKECEDAVNICRIDRGSQTKASSSTADSVGALKKALAQTVAKVQWPVESSEYPVGWRTSEVGKTGKPNESREVSRQTRRPEPASHAPGTGGTASRKRYPG